MNTQKLGTKRKSILIAFFTALFLLFFVGNSAAETQSVKLHPIQGQSDKMVTYAIYYQAKGASLLTTGLGLRVHYNSEAILRAELLNVFSEGLIVSDRNAKIDTEDFDGNPATDRFLVVAWADLGGMWPYTEEFPLELGKLSLELKAHGGEIHVGLTASSVAAGYAFEGGKP